MNLKPPEDMNGLPKTIEKTEENPVQFLANLSKDLELIKSKFPNVIKEVMPPSISDVKLSYSLDITASTIPADLSQAGFTEIDIEYIRRYLRAPMIVDTFKDGEPPPNKIDENKRRGDWEDMFHTEADHSDEVKRLYAILVENRLKGHAIARILKIHELTADTLHAQGHTHADAYIEKRNDDFYDEMDQPRKYDEKRMPERVFYVSETFMPYVRVFAEDLKEAFSPKNKTA